MTSNQRVAAIAAATAAFRAFAATGTLTLRLDAALRRALIAEARALREDDVADWLAAGAADPTIERVERVKRIAKGMRRLAA